MRERREYTESIRQQALEKVFTRGSNSIRVVAEVLNADQYRWVQDQWFVVTKDDLAEVSQAQPDLEALNGAIKRFVGNPVLLAWVPRTRGIQREQILMHGTLLSRAEELLVSLQNYATQLGRQPALAGAMHRTGRNVF